MRAGLQSLLSRFSDIEVTGEAADAGDLDNATARSLPDALLLDDTGLDAPAAVGWAARRRLPIVVLGEERHGYLRLVDYGLPGWAYLLKDADGAEIAGALRAAASGLASLDRTLLSELAGTPALFATPDSAGAHSELSAREREVLQLMAGGLPNKTIAVRLGISQHTVKFHVAAILAKFQASSRTEAVSIGVRRGYVSL